MRQWTEFETDYLIKNYSKSKIQDICTFLGFSRQRIYDKAQKLGLKKTVFYTTVTDGSKRTQFKKGSPSWCKGLKLGSDWNKPTQFKKGQTAWNKLPDDLKEISVLTSRISKIVKERKKRYETKQNTQTTTVQ